MKSPSGKKVQKRVGEKGFSLKNGKVKIRTKGKVSGVEGKWESCNPLGFVVTAPFWGDKPKKLLEETSEKKRGFGILFGR